MEITYYGHSCFGIKIGSRRLLFDPFIRGNPIATHVDVAAIETDFILISHAHGDHLADAEDIARRTKATLISNYEVVTWFNKKGIEGGQSLNHGGKVKLDFGTVRYVNAIHSSSFPDGTYGGNPGGFVIETAEGNFYYSGDTALTMDMQLVPMFCKLDFAMLSIGGYFTMDFNDAIIASDFIQCDKIIGMHYDSFPPIKINHEEAMAAFKSAGKELTLIKIGESFTI